MKKSVKEATKSFSYIFSSQIISLILSTFMSFLVPKILGIEDFGYWQLFLFYGSYVGFFHLGMIDGIYLRYGGKSLSHLNPTLMGSQFFILLVLELLFCLGIYLYTSGSNLDSDRQFVLLATSSLLIITNLVSFIGIIFQACNKLKFYAISTVVDKIAFIIFLLILTTGNIKEFKYYIISFIISKCFSLIFLLYTGRSLIFVGYIGLKTSLKEFWDNISVGAFLMISNISSMLILGVGRFGIERFWGITSFGKISFYLTLTSFFLLFISQISIVLYPLLKTRDVETQKNLYIFGSDSLSLLLNSLLLFYPLIYIFIQNWLPSYFNDINFFLLLFPLCLFDGKMQILFNTYMKVLRKERRLLTFNVISIIIMFLLSGVGIIIDSLEFIVTSMTITIILRSFLVENYLDKFFKLNSGKLIKSWLMNILLITIFWVAMFHFKIGYGWLIYFLAYLIFLSLQKKEIKDCFHFFKSI